jgi:hypothetical protein
MPKLWILLRQVEHVVELFAGGAGTELYELPGQILRYIPKDLGVFGNQSDSQIWVR